MKKIPYGRQWVSKEDIDAVVKVLKSDWLTQGPTVEKFESEVAKYCNAKYAVAFSSGTAALHSAYNAAGLGQGDEVITTTLTFAATANMLFFCGAQPIFSDVEADSLCISPEKIEEKITAKTKAIVTVDFAGHPCDYKRIKDIAKRNNLLIIEDACHSLGAEYKKKKIGSFSDMTILSFHPVKHITTGEGGMVLTNSREFYEKLKTFRSHGIIKKPENGAWYYEIENPAFNYRITDIQCALGLSQLKKINRFIKRRREIVAVYGKSFKGIKGVTLPDEMDYARSSWHIYPIQVPASARRKIFKTLQERGINVQVHYMPLHLHPFYRNKFGYKAGDFPEAEKYYQGAITLPLFPKMSDAEVKRVVRIVRTVLKKYLGK